MRSDARRNHDLVLDTAFELFARDGVRVPIEEIARAAGVGVGTVHRHFPTKEDLIAAVLVRACDPVIEVLDAALAGNDPVRGLESFLDCIVEVQGAHRAFAEEMNVDHDRSPDLAAAKATITDRMVELVGRAQDAGAIRHDVGPGDLRLLLVGLAQTSTASGIAISPGDKQRFVRLMLDGLRTSQPSELPGEPPPMPAR